MKLWKENNTDKEYNLENKEVAKLFCKSKYFKIEHYLLDRILLIFIGAKDGLNSIWDYENKQGQSDFEDVKRMILDKVSRS